MAMFVAALVIACAPRRAAEHGRAPDVAAQDVRPAELDAGACPVGSSQRRAADAEFARIDAAIRMLPIDGPPRAIARAIHTLVRGPCLRLVERPAPVESPFDRNVPTEEPDTAFALRAFWDAGGRAWIQSALVGSRFVTIPPSMRATLHSSAAVLACRPDDAACGTATAAWTARLARSIDAHGDERGSLPLDRIVPACDQTAAPSRDADWEPFRRCVARALPRRQVLPHGALRVPDSGWWVVDGFRGHFVGCFVVGAFDLRSGAGFLATRCSDGETITNKVMHGRVDVPALREAAWAALIRPNVRKHAIAHSIEIEIPERLRPAPLDRWWPPVVPSQETSDQQPLSWHLVRNGRVVTAGGMTVPAAPDDPAEQHAIALLVAAEESLRVGCVPARPPKLVFGRGAPGEVSLRSTSLSDLDELLAELRAAVQHAPAC